MTQRVQVDAGLEGLTQHWHRRLEHAEGVLQRAHDVLGDSERRCMARVRMASAIIRKSGLLPDEPTVEGEVSE